MRRTQHHRMSKTRTTRKSRVCSAQLIRGLGTEALLPKRCSKTDARWQLQQSPGGCRAFFAESRGRARASPRIGGLYNISAPETTCAHPLYFHGVDVQLLTGSTGRHAPLDQVKLKDSGRSVAPMMEKSSSKMPCLHPILAATGQRSAAATTAVHLIA